MPMNEYLYSYSGADAEVFTWFPQVPYALQPLESVHTISVSVHEAKGQARALGHRGIKGLARGIRTIAGSLIMTVINDHPLQPLYDQYNREFIERGRLPPSMGWSIDRRRTGVGSLFNNYDYSNQMAVLLPPFNMAVQYVAENSPTSSDARVGGKRLNDQANSLGFSPEGAGWMLVGVEFVDEAQVTSVNDIVTEMTFSFLACDFKPLSAYRYGADDDIRFRQEQQSFEEAEFELFKDLFIDGEGVAGGEGNPNLSPAQRAVAQSLGINNVDEQRLNDILNGGN